MSETQTPGPDEQPEATEAAEPEQTETAAPEPEAPASEPEPAADSETAEPQVGRRPDFVEEAGSDE